MKHIEINIGKACNNKCRFCMSSKYFIENAGLLMGDGDKYELVNYNIVQKEIINYAKKGYNSIGFLGGDISIHPNIYEIIHESKINGFENINVITNAMIFSDYIKAEKLILSGVTRVNISIHSHNFEVEDYITQILGGFQKKLKAIDNFNKLYKNGILKSQLSINIVLNKLNYKDILKTCIYFYKIKNIKDIRINFLWNRFFTSQKDKNDLELSYLEFLPYLKEIIKYSINTDLRITFDSIPPCIFDKLGFKNFDFILEKFMGDNKDHIEEISNINKNEIFNWKEQKMNELKTKFENCNKCLYLNKCQGVWKEYVDRYGKEEFSAI